MMRLRVAVVVLTALGCGNGEDGALQTAGAPDGGTEVEAGVLPDVPDKGDARADASADASDAAEAEAGADADAAPRCPPVAPANLEATFTEKRLAAGDGHTCGIRDNGTVACWGGGQAGPIDGFTVPPAGTFVRVAAGSAHTCGIRPSGEVECWGAGKTFEARGAGCRWPQCGQSLPPPGPFIEIAAGYDFSCGLRRDFTIECWGGYQPVAPPCGQFVQLSIWRRGCAVNADGHVECWPPLSLDDHAPRDKVKQVSVDDGCSCYVYTTGEVDCLLVWINTWPNGAPPTVRQWSRGGVAAVSCGWSQACAILDDGTVECGGIAAPAGSPPPDGTFAEVTCGLWYCCGLRRDGSAACWGSGDGRYMPPGFPARP